MNGLYNRQVMIMKHDNNFFSSDNECMIRNSLGQRVKVTGSEVRVLTAGNADYI